MKAVRMNPSWHGAGSLLLEVVEHGATAEARADAKAEIKRALAGYDAMLAKHTDYFDEKEVTIEEEAS